MGKHMILCQETRANRQRASYKEIVLLKSSRSDQAVYVDVAGEEA